LGFYFHYDEKDHLIKDYPKSSKINKDPESNSVDVINSGTDTIDLNQRRNENDGINRSLYSRGSDSITHEIIRGIYPSKKSIDKRSKYDEYSYNNIIINTDTHNIPRIIISIISIISKADTEIISLKRYPSIYIFISINDILSKILYDTGTSDDFIIIHFIIINRLSVKKYDIPFII
jgi:hypothetical protein